MATKDEKSDSHWQGYRTGLALGFLCLILLVFIVFKFGGLYDLEGLGRDLGRDLAAFSGRPFAPLLLVAGFCLGALIAAPQFVLIGIGVVAFGPVWGAIWSWGATLVSGSLTFWLGWLSGRKPLQHMSGLRLQQLTGFIARNALAASLLVRNIPAGPFLIVNMVFGAVRAPFLPYFTGLAFGSLPKILLVAFGAKAVEAALNGRMFLAGATAAIAFVIFLSGWVFVRQRRRKGEILSFKDGKSVDTAE